MAIVQEKIAPGWDNFEDLKTWREWGAEDGLFGFYRFPMLTEWLESEGRVTDSTGYPSDFGDPLVNWKFGPLTQAELNLIRSTFNRFVTIYTYAKTPDVEWKYFNAEMQLNRLTGENWREGHWVNVVLTFTNLTEVTPP